MRRRPTSNALKAKGEAGDDIVGYVFAVNGKLNSADVYPSNGLFRKMWGKLLTASAIEAIGHRNAPNVAPPDVGRGDGVPRRRGGGQGEREAAESPAPSSRPATATRRITSRPRAPARRLRRRRGSTGTIWRSKMASSPAFAGRRCRASASSAADEAGVSRPARLPLTRLASSMLATLPASAGRGKQAALCEATAASSSCAPARRSAS